MDDSGYIGPDVSTQADNLSTSATEAKLHVLKLAEQLGSVSKACRIMGYSRDSFYRFKKLYESGGVAALRGRSRKKPLLKNRVAPEIEQAVVELAHSSPTWGRVRVAEVLGKRGLSISPAGVRCVWVRHGLQTVALRLAAVEAQHAEQRLSGGNNN